MRYGIRGGRGGRPSSGGIHGWTPLAWTLGLALIFAGPASAAGSWTGSLGLAGVVQDESGSERSFLTQTQLEEGLILEGLTLHHEAEEGGTFEVKAWGFGDAEPTWHADLRWDPAGDWKVGFRFDRRESFFQLATLGSDDTGLGLRSDDWTLERWRGSVEWDGWSAATLGLDLRYHERTGTVNRPFFGLNSLYLLALELDETLRETTFRLETKDLPVSVLFEQSLATYERDNDRRPGDPETLFGDDPDLFLDAFEGRVEERDVPTSRLLVSWVGPRLEVAGSLLYSSADFDSRGEVSSSFAVGGGEVGTVGFVDEVLGSADLDTFNGDLRLGVLLAPRWTLRLEGLLRDRSTDAELLGRRLLRVTDPLGNVFELPALLDETTFLDVTDERQRVTLERRGDGWTAWAGGFLARRDTAWRISPDDPLPAGTPELEEVRDTDGYLAGFAWRRGPVTGDAEYERGDFEDFVFRTDPATVDRLRLRLRTRLGRGWDLSARARLEEADNPADVASLDHSSDALGLGLSWASPEATSGFGVDLDLLDLTTVTDLVLPGEEDPRIFGPGAVDLSPSSVSRYDLSLRTLGLHGHTRAGGARLSGSAVRVEDDGDTWPVDSWIGRGRVGFDLAARTELAVFGEYWSYDEGRAEADDYDVTRLGLALTWRFE